MTRIVLDEILRQKLLGLRQPVEVCEPSGKVVGRYTPVSEPTATTSVEPQLSEEELQRREQESEYTTDEVLARLEKL
jgi:hypothetical protein